MNLHHCVPTWNNLEDVGQVPTPSLVPPPPSPAPPPQQPPTWLSRVLPIQSHSTSLSAGPDTSMLDYEMAELTWENGQLTMHGLGIPRVPSKSNLADALAWTDKAHPRANGTLESLCNQAYNHNPHKPLDNHLKGACENDDDDQVPWFGSKAPTRVPVTLDALVPSNNVVGCSTRVGSCSEVARVPLGLDWSASGSASESTRRKRYAEDTCEQLRSMNTRGTTNNNGVTSASFGHSLENRSISKTFTVDDYDSASQSRPQRGRCEEEENEKQDRAKSTVSTKRSRAAAVHNQSERKRRDKINQRMKTLQKLVPNSNKADKASVLDEVIEYLKQLQAQVQMLSRMSLPSMLMPLAIQQQLQMSMMSPLNMGMNIGMGMDHMNMGMNPMAGRPGIQAPLMNMAPPFNIPLDANSIPGGDCLMPQGTLVSTDPLSTYLACQSLPMTMDAYSRMAAIYQQLQQQTQQQQQRQNHQQPGP